MSSTFKLPDVQDVLEIPESEVWSHRIWEVVESYDRADSAYWGIRGLSHMPWSNMPRTENQAVCFAGGARNGNWYAEVVWYHDGTWYHLRSEAG